jgi:hypothetical protein
VVGLELGRWDEPDLAVQASVVEPVDVLGDGDFDVTDVLPAALGAHRRVADAFSLEQGVERLSHRVVMLSLCRWLGAECHGRGMGNSAAPGANAALRSRMPNVSRGISQHLPGGRVVGNTEPWGLAALAAARFQAQSGGEGLGPVTAPALEGGGQR